MTRLTGEPIDIHHVYLHEFRRVRVNDGVGIERYANGLGGAHAESNGGNACIRIQ